MADEGTGTERLLAFTDGVVAIAITLLVLPLVEIVPGPQDGEHGNSDLVRLLSEHRAQFLAFALSFVLIARFWWSHHRLFEPVRRMTTRLVVINLFWTFTIVLLPLPTAILPLYEPWPLSFGFYTSVLLASSLSLTTMAVMVHRSAFLAPDRGAQTRNRLIGSGASTVALVAALALGLAVPAVNYWALLLLAVTPPFEALLRRRYARLDGSPTSLSEPDARLGTSPDAPGASAASDRE